MKRKIRVIKWTLITVAIILLAWITVWSLNFMAYGKYVTENYEKVDVSYNMYDGVYSYTVKKPYFHTLNGNFGILNDDNSIGIVIWPNLFITGKYDVGLMLLDRDTQHGFMFYTDNDLNYLTDDSRNDFTTTEIN